MRRYIDCKEDLQYELKSADGTLNENLFFPKLLVEDIENLVRLSKEKFDDGGDGVFNGVIGFCLMFTMDYLNKNNNLEKFVERIGDNDGN